MAFVSAAVGTPLRAARPAAASRTRPASTSAATRMQTRPGLPPGEDARENAPLRYYVPVPVETYEKRSFATVLPKTWEGEVVTIGTPDVPEMTKESIAEAKLVPVTAASTAAFLEYSNMVKAEREAALAAYVLAAFSLVEGGGAVGGGSDGGGVRRRMGRTGFERAYGEATFCISGRRCMPDARRHAWAAPRDVPPFGSHAPSSRVALAWHSRGGERLPHDRAWSVLYGGVSVVLGGSRGARGRWWRAGCLYRLASFALASWHVADVDPLAFVWVDDACTLHWDACCVLGGPLSSLPSSGAATTVLTPRPRSRLAAPRAASRRAGSLCPTTTRRSCRASSASSTGAAPTPRRCRACLVAPPLERRSLGGVAAAGLACVPVRTSSHFFSYLRSSTPTLVHPSAVSPLCSGTR